MKKIIKAEITSVTSATWYKVGRIIELVVSEENAIVGKEVEQGLGYFTFKVAEILGDYQTSVVDEKSYEEHKARHIEASHKKGVE